MYKHDTLGLRVSMTWCLTLKWKLVTVTCISWVSDFALYFEDILMYKHDTLE